MPVASYIKPNRHNSIVPVSTINEWIVVAYKGFNKLRSSCCKRAVKYDLFAPSPAGKRKWCLLKIIFPQALFKGQTHDNSNNAAQT